MFLVLWLLGFFCPRFIHSIALTGTLVHVLIVFVVILVVRKLLGIV